MVIARNTVVSIYYTLTNDSGSVFETNVGSDPLCYVHGTGIMISGLEEALEGMAPGASKTIRIQPKNGFGYRRNNLIKYIPKTLLNNPNKLQAGMRVKVTTHNKSGLLTVLDTRGDHITLDANHPLAGFSFQVNVEIVGVRNATQEEIVTRRASDEVEAGKHTISPGLFRPPFNTLH